MYPGAWAAVAPDAPAIILDRGAESSVVTYAELDAFANRIARLMRSLGLTPGDHVALVMDNCAEMIPVAWGCAYAGLIFTPVNWRLRPDEARFVIDDCGARVLFVSTGLDLAPSLPDVVGRGVSCFSIGGRMPGYRSLEDALAIFEPGPLPDPRPEGRFMFYSSGTTGRPKGVAFDLPLAPLGQSRLPGTGRERYGFGPDTVYLCPAPLYHAAGLGWSMEVQRDGATVVVMQRFDAERLLSLIERHRVTHAQLVPTMFVRLLRLPPPVQNHYDLSSLRVMIHAAAPCPAEVKRRIIKWFGPIVHEYYSGTEAAGTTHCTTEEWLDRPGTVGRAISGRIHICAEDGSELEPGAIGEVYFEGTGTASFRYHNDPVKTAGTRHPKGWTTFGDNGFVDQEGWLYLTDRKDFVIISGGVNIYPREIEDVLLLHPAVLDAAVFGVPDDEYGERVLAVVQLCDPADAGPAQAAALRAWCRERLADFKCPRSIDFREELPRHPTGKLYKRQLREEFISAHDPTTPLALRGEATNA